MLQKFILNLLVEAAQNAKIREFVADQVARLLPKLVAAVAGLLPSFGGSILKTFMDRVPSLPNLDDLPGAVSDVAQNIIDTVPDFDIPGVSDAVEGLTGIDVSETIKEMLRGFLR